jgi:2-C-methyl-D-erythritol 4-phosphate cytidylyltransferase
LPARLFAVIPCAGTGSRAGAPLPKQYKTVAGHNLLHYTLAAFDACSELTQTLVVLAPDDSHFDPRRFSGLRYAVRRCGGPTRSDTVLNGLHALSEFGARDHDWVLVHDAARAGITPVLIRTLVAEVRDDPVGGIVALPLADTLKRAASEDLFTLTPPNETVEEVKPVVRIGKTEARDGLWLAQTPQMFRLGLLRDALERARQDGVAVTDEASALERLGHQPRLVQGNLRNFKVTYPEDFALAEAMLAKPAKPAGT